MLITELLMAEILQLFGGLAHHNEWDMYHTGQLDFVHQQYRFRFILCPQIGIVETEKMLEQRHVTLTCLSINDFLRFRILDDPGTAGKPVMSPANLPIGPPM